MNNKGYLESSFSQEEGKKELINNCKTRTEKAATKRGFVAAHINVNEH